MGFWFFMLLTSLLIPAIMIIVGFIFSHKAPDNINYIYGYRTKRSMRNKETWDFAHKYCGKLWRVLGFILLIITCVVMLFFIKASKNTVGNAGIFVTYIHLAVLIGSIIPVERALKKNFDNEGNLKENTDNK